MSPTDWINAILSAAIGLVTGVATGFYFERRRTREAKQERDELRIDNEALRNQVDELRGQIGRLNVNLTSNTGSGRRSSHPSPASMPSDLPDHVRKFVTQRLDAAGDLPRARVFEHFGKTYRTDDVESALRLLAERGDITVANSTIRMTR